MFYFTLNSKLLLCCIFRLYFWIYRPHNLLHKYFTITVFDDHGVDNIKVVTISQWKSNPKVLIVHGGGGNDGEDSYVSIVAVPNLSCLECKKQRDEFYSDSMDGNGSNRTGYLCIKCNFTIHTKYCRSDTDPIFEPTVNLQCVDKLLIVANGLIHMVHVDLNMNKQPKPLTNTIDIKYVRARIKSKITTTTDEPCDSLLSMLSTNALAPKTLKCFDVKMMEPATIPHKNQIQQEPKNIVETIIADFAECETDLSGSDKQQQSRLCNQRNFNELIITCRNNVDKPARVRLLNHRSNRIISKNVNEDRNSITTIDLNGSMQSCSNGTNKTFDKAANAYEFSEDTEKCEKISTFRKRRLADKKYEFSEDNTENIIPYNRMRTVIRNSTQIHPKIRHSPAHTNVTNYGSSPPSAYEFSNSYHTHRASPSYGFRSPCGSPVGNRFMMSPPGINTDFPYFSCRITQYPLIFDFFFFHLELDHVLA